MAAKLLDDVHDSGVPNLNSYSADVPAIEESVTEDPHSVPAASGEALISEITPGETMPSAAFVEAEPRGGPETILLVEDEGFVRKATAEVLESAGYKLLIARSGAEALAAHCLLSGPVDLLLADITMSGMSGRELAAEFESLCPRTRVLLMSGYAAQLAWCQMSPYSKTYLAKPFSVRALLKKVRDVLDSNPFDCGALA